MTLILWSLAQQVKNEVIHFKFNIVLRQYNIVVRPIFTQIENSDAICLF
jgi:hypothetical protein